MTIAELTKYLEQQIPSSLALDWDNVGLLVGDDRADVKTVYVALDATEEEITKAIEAGADLILTHHPLIFQGCRRITAKDFVGKRILLLAEHAIACYAMHTNFDVQVMGWLAAERLGLQNPKVLDVTVRQEEEKGIGCLGNLTQEVTLEELAAKVRDAFGLSHVKVFGDKTQLLFHAAVSPGSGKGEIDAALGAGAQVLITGDVDHHSGLDAVARGLCVIDAGHYGLEHIFISYMSHLLSKRFPQLTVVSAEFEEPFWLI